MVSARVEQLKQTAIKLVNSTGSSELHKDQKTAVLSAANVPPVKVVENANEEQLTKAADELQSQEELLQNSVQVLKADHEKWKKKKSKTTKNQTGKADK